jgi:hypothetical protein
MPELLNVTHAELWELDEANPERTLPDSRVPVQFNPETLKLTYSNQLAPPNDPRGGDTGATTGASTDKRGTSGIQFSGKGSTKLSLQLWFDVTALPTAETPTSDVRRLTQKVAHFITPRPSLKDRSKLVPPALRFIWGTFRFEGVMDSFDESLEFFSADGQPLRANVSLSILQQTTQFAFQDLKSDRSAAGNGAVAPTPGTRPMVEAVAGQTLQQLAASLGRAGDWRAIAAANGIENPRLLTVGQLIDPFPSRIGGAR